MAATFPTGSFIESVHASAKLIVERAGIKTHAENIDRFLQSDVFSESSYEKDSRSHAFKFPLNFENDVEEVNLIGVFALLAMSNKYDSVLYEHAGKSTFDEIRPFVFSLYLSSSSASTEDDLLSARGLQRMTRESVAEHLQLSILEEKPHPTMPAITVGEVGGPYLEFVQYVTQILNETGDILAKSGYPDLGSFILEALKEAERVGKASRQGPNPDVFIQQLAHAIPGFNQSYLVGDQTLYLFNNAIHLIVMLSSRFERSDTPSGIGSLPALGDEALFSILFHLGILDVSQCTIPAVQNIPKAIVYADALLQPLGEGDDVVRKADEEVRWKITPIGTEEGIILLRAAVVHACDEIVLRGKERDDWRSKVTAIGLSAWFNAIAQDRPDYRWLPRYTVD